MQTLWQDLRYGARMLLKNRGFTLIAVVTLALGVGANTTIFSVVNAVLLRPLPYRDADRIVTVWEENIGLAREVVSKVGSFQHSSGRFPASGIVLLDWREQIHAFEQVAAWSPLDRRLVLTGSEGPQEVRGITVSANLFPLLGVQPTLGRTFTAEEDRPGGSSAVLLSHTLWRQRYGADLNILGKAIVLSDKSYTVVGVMPPGFRLPEADVWMPLAVGANTWDFERSSRGNYLVLAKLALGASKESALAELKGYTARIEKEDPKTKGWGVAVIPLHEYLASERKKPVLFLMGAVSFVLLIACVNVANLMLARAAGRRKEMAIRAALGASRWRIIGQLLAEGALIWFLGGITGLLLAIWGVDLLAAISPQNLLRRDEISLDLRVLGFTLGASFLTALLFGLIPALSASKPDLNETLKEGGGKGSQSSGTQRLRGLLVVAEVAIALVLLIGAGLLTNTLLRLWSVDLGFSPDNVLTMRVSLPRYKYPEPPQRVAFLQPLLAKIETLPGVLGAGTVYPLPFSGEQQSIGFLIEGSSASGLLANFRTVTPGYFQALGIPLRRGRWFSEGDVASRPEVMVINETMARRFWPNEDPIGKRLTLLSGTERPLREVVGIVGDARYAGYDREPGPEMYVPYYQAARYSMLFVVVRAESKPLNLATAARAQVQALDPDQPVEDIRSMRELLSNSVAPQRFYLLLLAAFGGFSLVLAAMGIYGVMSYTVTQNTREIGIRMALGAQAGDVLKLVVGQGMLMASLGVVIGLIGAWALTRMIKSLLFGVSATDPVTFAVLSLLLLGVALLASYLPARRAAKVDPMVALRHE